MLILCTWAAVTAPRGWRDLREKRRLIHELEQQNARMAAENQLRRERIQRLQESASEQELEIRKQLKLLRPGETRFILPAKPNPPQAQDQ